MTARKKKPTRKKAATKSTTAAKRSSSRKKATTKSTSTSTRKKSPTKKSPVRKPSAPRGSRKPVSAATVNVRSVGLPRASGAKIALTGLPWVIAVALGSVMLLRTKDSEGEPVGAPPLAPSPLPTPQPPVTPVTPEPKPDMSKADRLAIEFRRAKTAEIPRDILQKAKNYTSEPMGAIHFVTSTVNGKEYAFVLEQHSNLPKGDAGVSVFIER